MFVFVYNMVGHPNFDELLFSLLHALALAAATDDVSQVQVTVLACCIQAMDSMPPVKQAVLVLPRLQSRMKQDGKGAETVVDQQ